MTSGDNAPDLFRWPVARLAAALRAGEISARGVTEHFLARIARINPAINAFTFINPQARAMADAADARLQAGRPLGPLDGIPVAIKDNLWVGGMPATWGSPLFRDFVPASDEIAVAGLRASGVVFLGKTNCPEFAMRGVTVNPVYGATANPWDLSKTPGGSSGGAVAAVAAGLVPLSLATDGGGSIRRPAAHTGLVGFKPSVGRVPRGGGFPETMFDCEVIGAVARDVAGARLLFDVISEPRLGTTSKGLRLLFAPSIAGAPVDSQIVARCRAAAAQLSALGHAVTEGELPFDIEAAMTAWSALGAAGLAAVAAQQTDFFACVAPDFAQQARIGQAMTAEEHAGHIQALIDFRLRVGQAFATTDIIMTPAIAAQPWPLEAIYPSSIAGQAVGPRGHAVFTGWVNAAGLPAIALPAEPDDAGMPVGFQLIGPQDSDDRLFEMALGYEAAHPWAARWPAMAL